MRIYRIDIYRPMRTYQYKNIYKVAKIFAFHLIVKGITNKHTNICYFWGCEKSSNYRLFFHIYVQCLIQYVLYIEYSYLLKNLKMYKWTRYNNSTISSINISVVIIINANIKYHYYKYLYKIILCHVILFITNIWFN